MFKSFLLISWRNLSRQKGFSLINILGLTLGFTVGFMIILYIFSELSFDKFHKDHQNIYRVCIEGKLSEMPLNVAVTPSALGSELMKRFPEVEEYTIFEHIGNKQLLRSGDKKFYDNHLLVADTGFLRIFNFEMIYGNKSEALREPYTIVLTESVSKKYFGNRNPVGEIIRLNNQNDFTITGIIQDPPEETHLAFNFIISFETRVSQQGPEIFDNWGSLMYYTYVKLKPFVSIENFNNKMIELVNEQMGEEMDQDNISLHPYLQPITDIHLHSKLIGEIKPNSDTSYVLILSAIAFLILFIAGVNYMNLSTARSSNRVKEVGIRKIMGSGKFQIFYQFIGESVFFSLVGLIFAMALIEISLPVFNRITSKSISLNYFESWNLLIIFAGIALLFGIFSGSYPAISLSSVNPGRLSRRKKGSSKPNVLLRNILVFIQFAISAGLIIATIIIYSQLNYMRSKKLGFDRDNLITIFLRNEEVQQNADVLKETVLSLTGVESATLASSIPGTSLSGSSLYPEGFNNEPWLIYNFDVDQDFIENTFHMKIIQGRNFSEEFPSDSNAIIINNTLRKKLGWEDALGKIITNNEEGDDAVVFHVIGVVDDFNFRSLHESIEPTMILFRNEKPGFLVLRLYSDKTEQTLRLLSKTWNDLNPELPFDYEFLNESFDNLYDSERRLGLLFIYLTIFAIFIASLGLLGLASYTAEQRTKEIGIRKVLGATVMNISKMLSMEYLKLIMFANLFAWPLTYYLMQIWLQNFSFRTGISWTIFLFAGIMTLLPALIIINLQTIKIASSNPVNALRYE